MKPYILGVGVILAGVLVLGLFQASITGNVVKEEKIVLYFPLAADFPNENEASVIFNLGFPGTAFRVGDKSADIIMFLDSEMVPGLKLGYDVKTRKLYGGMPLMSTSEVNLDDGKTHQLAYAFSRDQKKQQILLDGKLLVEGEFTGVRDVDYFTGYSIYNEWKWLEYPHSFEVSFK